MKNEMQKRSAVNSTGFDQAVDGIFTNTLRRFFDGNL